MDLQEKIAALLEEKYASDEVFADTFTVEIELKPGNRLNVFIDSDSPMTFEKCQKLSRHLESHLDQNLWLTEKYTLEVSSPGVGRPLKFVRQYVKNIGRTVEVQLLDKSLRTGKLTAADDEKITLESEVVEKEGNKKVKKQVQEELPFSKIEKTVVKIVF
jgi:ribosome maturation factor RimP